MTRIVGRMAIVGGIVLASWVILGLGALAAEAPAEAPVVEAIKVDQAPKIDGDLSDACWQLVLSAAEGKAAQVPDFFQLNKEEPAKVGTKALLA